MHPLSYLNGLLALLVRAVAAVPVCVFIGCLVALLANSAAAATIAYTATDQGSGRWRYDYVVANAAADSPIEEFTVYFALGAYANLAVVLPPSANWDSLVAEPDADIPDGGYFDALALAAGIAPGASLGGFAVTFDYLAAGTPGAQSFEIVDPHTFVVLSSGTTTAVPVPATGWLLATALPLVWRRGWRRFA